MGGTLADRERGRQAKLGRRRRSARQIAIEVSSKFEVQQGDRPVVNQGNQHLGNCGAQR